MRYLARRYGEFFGYDIPAVLDLKDIPVKSMPISERNRPFHVFGDMVVVTRINRLNAKQFVKTVLDVRKKFPDKLIYLPFFGLPYDYPVLFYLGIDILDNSTLALLGDYRCSTEVGIIDEQNCSERNKSESNRMMNAINLSLRNNKFRELVEFYSSSPFSKELLRTIDMDHFSFMQYYMDLRPKKIIASSIEGLYRPEIIDFRRRVSKMKQTADNLLLIPCSAIKPYSRSKTHRILQSFIGSYLSGIQEVIVTSPLGIVPRELEMFFPAAYYDIPVTGYWYSEETKLLRQVAEEYFRDKKYNNVFYVLPDDEGGVLNLFDKKDGIKGPLNVANSEKLSRILARKGIKGNKKTKEKGEYSNIMRYLYDVEINPEGLEIKNEGNRKILLFGNSEYLKKTRNGVRMLRGLAELLSSSGKRTVEIDGIFKGENVYTPGIRSITEEVKPGMEVALFYEDTVVGTGISELSSFDLKLERNGIGVSEVSYFKD